jgi:probable DNA metabolism protein
MRVITLSSPDDVDGWRDAARMLLAEHRAPDAVVWQVGAAATDLFATTSEPPSTPRHDDTAPAPTMRVPRTFLDLANSAALHRDPERFALLYAMLWRLRETPRLTEDHADPLVRRIETLAKSVRRDIHKMRAFVRFRSVKTDEGERYVAWFEPEHHIVRANAAFFVNRFASMRWSILTPEVSLHWDGAALHEGPAAERDDAPEGDPIEEVWKTYYASIFNPARVKIGAMLREMPRKYWKNMPETALVPQLLATAQARESGMIGKARARPSDVGDNARVAWEALRDEAAACTRCHLYKPATQTVFGEGPIDATMMFVGEQPGDQEDLAGHPFVGPAGQVFDRALAAAGITRAETYVTNAVKHFKFEPRGKRRIHAKPDAGEIEACRWWIEQEQMLLRPKVTVALGATAARSLFGKVMTIGRERGREQRLPDGGAAWITVHPSYLLRLPDEAAKASEYERFVEDLKMAHATLA